MGETKLRWGIKVDKLQFPRIWSLGVSLSHYDNETYLYMNLVFFNLAFGKMNLEVGKCQYMQD